MVEVFVTVLALLLLVGIIFLLLQEPQLLAAGSAIALGVVFASLPLLVTMAPFFGALVFGAGAVSITYGVMSINAFRRTQELRRELAIRQVRESVRDSAVREDAASPRGRASEQADDGDDDDLDEWVSAGARRSGIGAGGRGRGQRSEGAVGRDGRSSERSAEAGGRTALLERIDEEMDRLDRVDRGFARGNGSGSSRRSEVPVRGQASERARSFARLARRRS